MTTKLMPLSYSRLSTFESCPQKFDYLYVTKNIKDSDNEFTIYGTRVHDALETYGKAAATSSDAAQAVIALADATPDVTKHYPLVDRIIRLGGTQLFEHQMAINRSKQPCGWFASDVWIRGIADVLVVNGVRAWCLDWKTGKPKDNPTQLQLFAALVFAHYPEVQEVTTSFIWLNHDDVTNAVYKRSMESHLWLALEPRFVRVQDAVDGGVFKTKPSGLCPYCPAKGICADARLRR
jgi:CRISPR/Cas system-associated exonuclease Cas4 (RecB family)